MAFGGTSNFNDFLETQLTKMMRGWKASISYCCCFSNIGEEAFVTAFPPVGGARPCTFSGCTD